ncbi:glycosyltransferase family 4 protein [Halanaeroarchaeum sulfurireducens]|uniref:glycosyltransferase family 4 protein n=1 Tax=Halanaeroarchaeum sulfurireducens TaxID=1604004 RepID=UPI001F3DA2D4|nr:glycosyltransferase family 4 protein [Halanaeroarchaeum sulfurireducens]
MYGDGPLREELEVQVRELGIDASVTFQGHVPYDEMSAVYRSGDVLVLPSRAEGVPRTVLEAIASGARPVTSDFPQIRSIVASNGHLVDADSLEGMFDAISSALGDVEKGEAWQSVDEMEWERTVDRTTGSLESIVH